MSHSKSSFALPMRLLPPRRASDLRRLYRWCHDMDAIADSNACIETRRAALIEWKKQLAQHPDLWPQPIGDLARRYNLPVDAAQGLIEGMILDVEGKMVFPERQLLAHYCDCVAGQVGRMAIRIFGCNAPEADNYAMALGQLLQRINILRDIAEDAQRERCYLLAEWIAKTADPSTLLLETQTLHKARQHLIADIVQHHQQVLFVRRHLPLALCCAPAFAMHGIYWEIFIRLARNTDIAASRPHLSGRTKLIAALRGLTNRFAAAPATA